MTAAAQQRRLVSGSTAAWAAALRWPRWQASLLLACALFAAGNCTVAASRRFLSPSSATVTSQFVHRSAGRLSVKRSGRRRARPTAAGSPRGCRVAVSCGGARGWRKRKCPRIGSAASGGSAGRNAAERRELAATSGRRHDPAGRLAARRRRANVARRKRAASRSSSATRR